MTQRDRDRLVALKKARKGLITQREAAEEPGQSERHVRRLLKALKARGDQAVVYALRGRLSNRRYGELPPDQPGKDRSVGECGIAAGPRYKTNSVGQATAARPTSRLL